MFALLAYTYLRLIILTLLTIKKSRRKTHYMEMLITISIFGETLPLHPVTLPTIKYQDTTESCSICQSELSKSETIYNLSCNHKFHTECANKWFIIKATCPNCGTEIY